MKKLRRHFASLGWKEMAGYSNSQANLVEELRIPSHAPSPALNDVAGNFFPPSLQRRVGQSAKGISSERAGGAASICSVQAFGCAVVNGDKRFDPGHTVGLLP